MTAIRTATANDMPLPPIDRRLSVAPMLDLTDRYFRRFVRLLTRRTLLYTEMITANALLHGDPERLLAYDNAEHPIALQVAGSDPDLLARALEVATPWRFDEINLNVGCPSDRVSKGRFGACLMAEPDLVAECVTAMMSVAGNVPVTVKHRIGIDDLDSYELLVSFVEKLARAGVKTFVVHARKAWLKGLSPKENRTIPPLRYDWVHALKRDFPDLEIILNGGVTTIEHALVHLRPPGKGNLEPGIDGVMIGRAAYETPFILATADQLVWNDPVTQISPCSVARELVGFSEEIVAEGEPVSRLTRHIMGLFHGRPGARAWRRHLSTFGPKPGAGPEVILRALEEVEYYNG